MNKKHIYITSVCMCCTVTKVPRGNFTKETNNF